MTDWIVDWICKQRGETVVLAALGVMLMCIASLIAVSEVIKIILGA